MLYANAGKARIGGKDINVPAPPKATRINAGEHGGGFYVRLKFWFTLAHWCTAGVICV